MTTWIELSRQNFRDNVQSVLRLTGNKPLAFVVKSNAYGHGLVPVAKTAVKNGEDMNSTYDEANPYDAGDEYIPKESLETDVDDLGMHIGGEEAIAVDPIDDILSRTEEDNRPDLDEEGYPINDRPKR